MNLIMDQSSDGRRLGRGVRFSMAPMAQTFNLCAERFWRVSASLQFATVPPEGQSFILQQTNSFASKQCGAEDPATLNHVRTRPQENLLLPAEDGAINVLPLAENPQRFTSMTVQAAYNRSRPDMEDDPPDDGLTAFAGRGLYGDFDERPAASAMAAVTRIDWTGSERPSRHARAAPRAPRPPGPDRRTVGG